MRRKKTRLDTKKIMTLAAIILAALLVHRCSRGRSEMPERIPVDLNATLTNEMSDTSTLARMDRNMTSYMSQWGLKGASLAIMRNDSLVYAKGYGWADAEGKEEMRPGHIMRLASVSKLITATGIMKLQEQGMLSLQDKVFGSDGILNDEEFTSAIKDKRCLDITVEHLLRHQAGFGVRAGDPMFTTATIMQQNHLKTAPDNHGLSLIVLKRKLAFAPGTSQTYSNFGYMLLSLIVEKVTGEGYERWMHDNVLVPAGCTDMHIAGNYLKDRMKNEVKYYVHAKDEPVDEFNNSGRKVVRCYGGSDITSLQGAGGWVASVPELARFVASIDGRPEVPDILSQESIQEMTRYIDDETFSLGWNDTRADGTWTRTGTLSCTSALIKYYPDGECWIMVTNTGTWKGPRFTKYTSTQFTRMRDRFSPLLPERDFFYMENPKLTKGKDKKKARH